MNLTEEEKLRYDRHFRLNELGVPGQMLLKQAKVLVIGAGGLGCPALLYLAAAGVGTIGVADFDRVEISNLQRQVLFTVADIGKQKTTAAKENLLKINSNVEVHAIAEKITNQNAMQIFKEYDLILDGSDNFETRYLVNDACVLLNKTLVYASVQKFGAQVAVFNVPDKDGNRGATYRCLHPVAPDNNVVLNCDAEGVLGAVPGIAGTIQATEAIKIITGIGTPLRNKLLFVDALTMQFTTLNISRNEKGWLDFPDTENEFLNFNYSINCTSKTTILVPTISITELNNLIASNSEFQLIDVREQHEYPPMIYEKAINIPLSEIETRYHEIRSEVPVILICSSGKRSSIAGEILTIRFNRKNITHVAGGVNEWLLQTSEL